MKHRIINEGIRLEFDPPLPPRYTYVIEEDEENGMVVTQPSYVVESTATIQLQLDTMLFPRRITNVVGSIDMAFPYNATKTIQLTANVRALRYGGGLYRSRGDFGRNFPDELPLEVLGWKAEFIYGKIRYQSGTTGHGKPVEYEIAIPDDFEIYKAEKKGRPSQPSLMVGPQRHFFRHWLLDRNLTVEAAQELYAAEVLKPHKEAEARYRGEMEEMTRYCQSWRVEKGVILLTAEEIWLSLQEKTLPQAAELIQEKARKALTDLPNLRILLSL